MATVLDGKMISAQIRSEIKSEVDQFLKKTGRAPGLATVLVGDNPASHTYVANKIKACAEVGFESMEVRLSASVSAAELKSAIEKINQDPAVDGMILQLPLPKGLDADEALQWIAPNKDADCLTSENLGRLWSGRSLTTPCTPWGVMAILEHFKIPVAGRRAVVVGRSQIVGKPMAHLLLQADATVTICHSKTPDLREHTLLADLVVVAAGRPEFLGTKDFKKGAVVIDVGIHRQEIGGKTRLCGDVRFNELEGHVAAATPVPGGVGPMTITMLLENTLVLAENR
jgi:methylenetetrahydrofolate dehydrogenase (NADP+)/methenyltetrahydrofolate cyclohydrolase